MGTVYGDSTPFPYGADFIEIIRHAVECGVLLLQAQAQVDLALEHGGSVENQRLSERARLDALADAIQLTVDAYRGPTASDRLQRAATAVAQAAHDAIAREVEMLEGQASGQMSGARAQVQRARESTFRAVEAFVLRHDLPNTEVGVHLTAGETGYTGEALVSTPFGIEATFDLAIPAAHEWARARRVAEVAGGMMFQVPREAGWLSRRMELSAVKLDRLFVSEVMATHTRGVMRLRKGPRSGAGYAIELAGDENPVLRLISEEGVEEEGDGLRLDGAERAQALRLWARVLDSTADLGSRRQAMRSCLFDERPIEELDDPRAICERMLMVMTPIVQEIAARSGAPGELVLRRDAGEGRREEVYITKAELFEKVLAVAEELRHAFDGFELEGPRSPRAPMPSEEIHLDLIERGGR